MSESTIHCPNRGATIPLTQALIGQVRATVETERDLTPLREQRAEPRRKTREAPAAQWTLMRMWKGEPS